MSLQTYDINILPNRTQKVSAQGRYIYYLKGTTPLIDGGTTPSAAGNQELRVVAGSTSIVLMPGQSFRFPPNETAPSEWSLSNSRSAETITGMVFIGEGDFDDNNTSNTNFLKLDATFANNVKVTNTTAERVPVAFDPNTTFKTAGNVMAYTAAYTANTQCSANTAIQLLSAAANVAGAVLNKFDLIGASSVAGTPFTILAKATVPANTTDGDVLFSGMLTSTMSKYSLDVSKEGQVQVPAGKAVWYICGTADLATLRSALLTVL